MDSTVQAAGDNFLIPNGTFFVVLIIFLIVLGVIWQFVVPPISKVLQDREDLVTKTVDDNHKAARAFSDAESTYKGELTDARGEATKIRDEARGEGQKILDDMRAKARTESDAIQREADEALQVQADQVAAQLRPGVGTLSATLADRVLGVDGSGAAVSAGQTGRG